MLPQKTAGPGEAGPARHGRAVGLPDSGEQLGLLSGELVVRQDARGAKLRELPQLVLALGQPMVHEHRLNGLEKVLGGKIHDRQILVVELTMFLGGVAVSPHEAWIGRAVADFEQATAGRVGVLTRFGTGQVPSPGTLIQAARHPGSPRRRQGGIGG